MYNTEVLLNRIFELAQQRKVSVNKMLKESGLTKSLIDNMKRNQIPSVDKILALAEYFSVSVDYLLGLDDIPNRKTVPETK